MKSVRNLGIRLLQETSELMTKVIVKDSEGNLYEIESLNKSWVSCPSITESMKGPMAHNQLVLVLNVQKVSQRVTIEPKEK